MGVEFFVTLIDWISSVFVSIYNVITHLGISLFGYILIFCGIVLTIRVLGNFSGRLRLYGKIKKLFREKKKEVSLSHFFLRSFLWRPLPYAEADFSFHANGKDYYVKLFPGFVKGYRVLFDSDSVVILSRLFWKKKFVIDFCYPMAEDTEAILLFSPAPKGFYEPVRTSLGVDRFPLEGGRKYGDLIFFDQEPFLRQLDRILDGYVDSFYIENQKQNDD